MNTNTNTQTDTKTIHMSLQTAHFFPHFFKMGKYLLPLLAGLFILAACGGGGAAPTTVEPTPTTGICETNLFDTRCNAPDVETKRNEKIVECFTGDAVGTATCKDAREANTCLEDPFDEACTADTVDAAFAIHLEPAKTARAIFCRQGNNVNNAELCGNAVTSLCPADPFDTICGANVAARQTFCRSAITDDRCTTTISTFCATITAGNFADVLCGTPASAAVRGAYCVGLSTNRPSGCGDDATEGSLIRAYCEGGGAALSDTANCATSLANACLTQPFGDYCTSDANIRAQAVMCRANTNGINSCDATITAICAGKTDGGNAIDATPLDSLCAGGTYDEVRQTACDGQDVTNPANEDCAPVIRSLCTAEPFNPSAGIDTAKFDCAGSATYDNARNDRNTFCRTAPTHGTCTRAVEASCGTPTAPTLSNIIFDDLCDVGYDDAREKVCGATPKDVTLPEGCGSELTEGYLVDYCKTPAGAANNIHCPVRYEASGVRAERWQTDAVDATNENPLKIIPAGEANKDDALTNFIVGGEEGLGFVADGTIITQILRDNRDNGGRNDIRLNAVTNNNEDEKSGFGYTRILRGDVASTTFRNKTYVGLLSGTDVGAPIHDNTKTGVWIARLTFLLDSVAFSSPSTFNLDVNFGDRTLKTRANSRPWVNSDGSRTLGIDGKFTNAGVLYGTTDFYVGVGSTTSSGRGTISGLIGVDGAVGVFASDTLASNAYAGGFVATLGGCTAYPFNAACTSDVDIQAQAIACRGDIMTNGAGGCDATARVICVDGTIGSGGAITANILDPLCQAVSAVDDHLVIACNVDTTDTGDFAFCPARIASLCPATGPRNPECLEPTRTGNVDFALWRWNPADTNGTDDLDILSEIGQDDPPVNYVEGAERDLLNRGFLLDDTGLAVKTGVVAVDRNLDLSDLGVSGNIAEKSGVALYRVTFDEFEGASKIRHYAGIWPGTDLGAPLRADTNTNTTWKASATLFLGNTIQGDNLDFTLEVNFSGNTIKTTNNNPILITHGANVDSGHLTIDGKFTALGVIYGRSEFAWATDAGDVDLNGGVSTGSLTGLIGEYGAVGAFISDGDATAGTYVGGFIALNPNACDATPFSDFCKSTTAYDTVRFQACIDDVTDAGNFAGCPAFVAELCPISGARHPDCPAQVQTGNADFIRWKQDATDATNTNTLTILDKLTGTSDPEFSYVEGRADGLERGNDYLTTEQKSEGFFIGRGSFDDYHQILRLSDLAGSEDTASGVAFRETVIRDNRSLPFDRKYYAGLLSGTNLGAPISASTDLGTPVSAENPMIAIWDARLEVTDLSTLFKANFKLEVNFGNKTIRTREDENDPAVPLATTSTSITIDSFNIKGTFTEDGVIYGKTELKRRRGGVTPLTSEGTLTGLIGERGAVGVFFANDKTKDDAGVYVGGFVAVPRYCEFYPFANSCDTDEDIREQLERCRDDINTNGVGGCNATLDIICRDGTINNGNGGAIAADNPFADPLCTSSSRFDDALIIACNADITDTGKFSTCPTLLSNLCPNSGNRNANCPPRTLTDNVVDFARWIIQPVVANGTEELTVLSEVGNDDPLVSYVEAGKTTINRGVVLNPNGSPRGGFDAVFLTLGNFSSGFDKTSGFSLERVAYNGFTGDFINISGIGRAKYYAGIFSTTDVGAPLTAENSTEAIWDAKFSLINHHNNRHLVNRTAGDFSLEVNFGDKTIKTRAADAVRLDFGGIIGNIIIDGEFTDVGVIYGKSELVLTGAGVAGTRAVSNGSLTGLIGVGGAVGVFISDGDVSDAGPYVGGFVARNPQPCLDTPFDGHCRETPGIFLARANMCNENMEVNGVDGCNDTIVDVCSDTDGSGSAINPFHAICGVDATYDESRSLSCANNRNGYGDKCMTRTTQVCEAANDNNPLDVICAGLTYDVQRQALCAGDSVDNPSIVGCAPVIADFCGDNPFNNAQSAGDAKFDCNGSDTYHLTRRAVCVVDNQRQFVNPNYDCTDTIRQTCTTDPNGDSEFSVFLPLCTNPSDSNFKEYEQVRLDFCVDNLASTNGFSDGSDVGYTCEGFIVDDCEIDPFEDKCYILEYRDFGRFNACSSSDLVTDLEGAPPANCNRPELSGKICGTVDTLGTDPFAPICAVPEAVVAGFVLLDVQRAFCRDGANINGRACADTVTDFCDVAEGRDLFDDLCNTGNRAGDYHNYRVFACQVTDANTAVNSECGTIVSTNCTGVPETDSPACPVGGTLPAAAEWAYTARNADNTTRLRVLDEVGLGDADTNYVQGNATELNLGVLLEDNGDKKANVSLSKGSLSITDLDNVGVDAGDATGGVAFIGVAFNEFTTTNKVKHYAGLLDNIDLGAPLADSTANGIWNARFSAIVKEAVHTDIDTSIVINFDTRSLTTNDEDLVTLSNSKGSISIAGKFTDVGVIYGTSSWTSTSGAESATGSVTGLIGAKGAIGAFVSSGESTNDEEYAGGFVAAPVTVCVGLDAFTNSLCDGPVGKAGRIAHAATCRTTDCPEFVVGNAGPTISACTHSTNGNPHQTGCESDNFDAERIARNAMCIGSVASYDAMVCGAALTSCLGTGTDSNCGQLVGAYCDANAGDNRCTDDESVIEAIVCRDSVFDPLCNTGYDEERQTACAGQNIDTLMEGDRCKPVIAALCDADPFAIAAGAGTTTFNCNEADTYIEQRQIACAGENIAELSEGDRCLPVITALCNSNPFDNAKAGLGGTIFDCTAGDTYLPERLVACKDNIDVNGMGGCDTTISDTCTADAFDSFCFDRDNDGNYGNYETARISYCQARVFRTDGFTNDTPDSKICADFVSTCPTTPFDDKCKIVDNYASDRLGFCSGTLDDLTAAYGTLANCNTVDLVSVICDTGDVLAINPFAPICSDPTAIAIIDNFDLVAVQQGFCRDGANINKGDCADTITNFCDVASGANLFDDLCNTGDTAVNYTDYRVAACQVDDANTLVNSECGNILSTHCTNGNSPACAPAEGTLPTSVWLYTAPNKDDTGRLKILAEIGLDDAYTNYVQGNATGLNLGVLLKGDKTRKDGVVGSETVLSINHLDNVDARAEGSVAFTSISYASLTESFTQNPVGSRRRYYAGLLDNVDLGGPLPETTVNGIWNARFYATISEAVQIDIETSMVVNFGAKTIKTRDVDDDYGLADPVTLSGGAGSIVIAGEFTDAGVIFGTSSWIFGDRTSAGTVTGLIGKYGAIGAFVSDGKNSSDDVRAEYAGGFVAAPVDCSENGTPFHRLCVDNEIKQEAFCDADVARVFDPDCAPYTETAEKTMFAETCRMKPRTAGCDRVIVDSPRLTVNDCTDIYTGNPYQTECGAGEFATIFAAERTARTLTCKGNDVYNASQCSYVLGNCFDSITDTGCYMVVKAACDTNLDGRCVEEVPKTCGPDPFNIICGNDYAEQREIVCDGQVIDMLMEGDRCAPVIAALCDADPFATAAGTGTTTTFNCNEADSYLGARQSECAGQDIANPDGRCMSILSTLCTANPFATAAGVGAMTIDCTVGDTYKMARETACRANPNADGDSCVTVFTTIETNDCIRSPGRLACDAKVREPACPSFPTRNDLTCAAVIAARCRLDPLNSRAGVGTKKYDCANYRVLPNYDPNNVTPLVKMQQDALVESIRAEFEALREARVALCKNPANSEDPLCLVPTTAAFIATCASNPFDTRCESFGDQYGTERANRITNCLTDASPPECAYQEVRAELLTSCNGIVDNSRPAAPGCVLVTAEFCPTAVGADVFNSACDADYTIQQVAACVADVGVDGRCDDLITNNCPEDSTKPECARKITTAVWENYAVSFDNVIGVGSASNSEGFTNALNDPNNLSRLTVLDEVGADDPVFNYVKADADGLELGVVLDENDNLQPYATINERVLKLYDAGTHEDTTSGVAFALINYGGFTYDSVNARQRFYAGILSGTDLGGPITNTTQGFVEWKGKFGVIFTGRYYTKDFTLNIDFSSKRFFAEDRHKSPESGITEFLRLDGSFNDAGVMYGASHMQWIYDRSITVHQNCEQNEVTPATDNNPAIYNLSCTPDSNPELGSVFLTPGGVGAFYISTGSLTGLIGERGAVGVFVSDDAQNAAGPYVGGFVVDNPDVSPDCSAATGKPFDVLLCPNASVVRRDLCINRDFPEGVNFESNCNTPELWVLICSRSIVPSFCTEDERYDYTRQLACGGQDVNNPDQPLCVPVIEKLCTADPFNPSAGPGANKLDCLSANSGAVVQARNTRIALCLDEATDDDPLCAQTGVPAVLATCAADPLDAVCTDIAEHYTQERETRLETCRMDATMRAGVKCDNALPTICAASDTPFSDLCVNNDTARIAAVDSCLVPATADADVCNTIVSGARSVKYCIANPYKARCSQPAFYAARAVICESEATSFTAGCLSDSDFTSNYRPIDVTDVRRANLITRCTDSNTDNDEGCHTIAARTARADLIKTCAGKEDATGCNTVIANGTTLLACIKNPFLADCSGNTIASALANSPDAVMMRDALVTRCGDSGMDSTGCDTPVGTLTIAGCAMDRADLACSGGVFDAYIVFDCTIPANVFKPRCQGGIDETVITARAKLALSCAVADTGTGCDTIVSGALTVKNCNDTPFVAGCEDVAFANARFEVCKTDSSNAACNVAVGQGVTNYITVNATDTRLDDAIYKTDNSVTTEIDESVAVNSEGVAIANDINTPIDESKALIDGVYAGGLTLAGIDTAGAATSGFAFAYIPTGRGGSDGTDRYYAGLLSGTDVGAEITADAMWHGKIAIVSGLNGSILTEQADFILDINFANKTLTSGDIAVPRLGGFFAIDGKFAGKVIYGATSLRDGLRNGVSSIGSVTGLIGQNGAVGAFISNGSGALVNTFGEYAGGFVASSTAPAPAPVDCSDPTNPDPACDNPNDVSLCMAYNLADLKNPDGNDGLNPAQIQSRMIAQNQCIPVLERLEARELGCANPTVLNDENHACATVITQVCSVSYNLFKTAAGTGDTKFDCLSVTRYDDRRKQICRSPAYRSTISACGDIIVDICTNDDPFTQTTGRNPTNLCNSSYDDARKTACMGLVSRDTIAPQKCFNTIEQVCNDNPFDENFCYATHFDYTAKRMFACYADMNAGGMDPNDIPAGEAGVCNALIATNCPAEGGSPHAECRSMRFTQWADDVNADDSDSAVASIPAIETKTARILLGRANGLDTKTNVTSILAPEFVVRLGLSRSDADYTSGIAVFSATTTNGTIGHYAGILSGTNVGAPITDDSNAVAEWRGDFAWVSDDGARVKRAYGFRLNVNYDAATISTPTDFLITDPLTDKRVTDALGHVPGYANTDSLSLDAFWNINGILIGTTTLCSRFIPAIGDILDNCVDESKGTLTGMIGNRGAVGVFASNDEQPLAYAGGFIAKPTAPPAVVALPDQIPATAITWIGKAPNALAEGDFTRSSVRYESRFIIGGEDGFGLNEGGSYEDLNYSLSTPTLDDDVSEFVLRLDKDAAQDSPEYKSGVVFFHGNIGGTNSERFFTGLLSGTTVGANLLQRERYAVGEKSVATAIWGGVIGARFGHHSSTEVGRSQDGINIDGDFYVTDRNFQIEINFEASTIKTPEGRGKGAFYAADLRLDGRFDRNGIMSGTVTTAPKSDETFVVEDSRLSHGDGTFTGIIGRDAAIGVFKANKGNTGLGNSGYAGGFFATPCTVDIFNLTCADRDDPVARTAYCNDIDANRAANPFNVGCNNEVGIEIIRRNACVKNEDVDTRCPDLIVAFCLDATSNTGSNPFNDVCARFEEDPLHTDNLTIARNNACLDFGTEATAACAARVVQIGKCTPADPYAYVGCNTAANINDEHRRAYCLTDAGSKNPACPNANSGNWVASFTDDDELTINPNTTEPTNEFLQIADKTISTAETTLASGDAGGEAPTPTTLDFGEFSYGGLSLSANDGLAYFNGYQSSTLHYYAGIFGSTDLGAPIDVDTNVIWSGMLSINGTDATFQLGVVFDSTGGTDNTVKGFITNPIDANPNDLLIAGTFDANGVITGKVHFADFMNDIQTDIANDDANGSLSGLISPQGAIAVFISKATGDMGYAGGFIATHSVDICKADVFDAACPVRTSISAVRAFCMNITDNAGTNPFNGGCSLRFDLNTVATAQRDACLNFATFPDESCQTLASVRTACLGDPFTNAGCAARNDYAAIAGVYCATPAGIANTANCPNANSGKWVASFTGEKELNTNPDTTDAKNEFLQIAVKRISTTETTAGENGVEGDPTPTPTTLDFSAFSYGGESFVANHGLAYFSGYQDDILYHYAGIFGTTDLGLPIAINTNPSVMWDGMLKINGADATFDLTVVFNGSNNTVKGFIANVIDTKDLLIAGEFDAKGVITGDVHFDVFADETTPATPDTFNGELSGLIGVDGAVAVFISTATGTDGYAGGFIATPSVAICKADVFDTACPVHTSIPAINVFCTNATDNAGENPFKTGCSQASNAGAVATAQRDACLGFATFPHVSCQTLSLVRTACAADPFTNAVCATRNDYDTIVATYCATPAGIANPTECPNANSGRWVASRTDLNTDPATTDAKNEFLQIADKTISTTGTTKEADGAGGPPEMRTLNLSELDALFSADDGLAYFSGYQGADLHHYAGIFGTSDLGAPITEDGFRADWTGMLSINGTNKELTLTVAFSGSDRTVDGFVIDAIGAKDLLIDGDFGANGVITGKVHYAEFTNEATPETPAPFNGTLSGLIGVDGAVAVFTSTATGTDGYAGGFVAAPEPQVNFADWTGSFAGGFNNARILLDTGVDATGFVADTTSFITLNDADEIVLSNQTITDPTILRLDSAATDGEYGYESGVAFWKGMAGASGSEVSQSYAGLLVGTDLGAPLTDDNNKAGVWTGKISGITNGDTFTDAEVKFLVTFDTSLINHVGTITSIRNKTDYTYDAGATATGSFRVPVIDTNDSMSYSNQFNFSGLFNEQGVIRGGVNHDNGSPRAVGISSGTFNGLIGVNGAVGVFKSNNSGQSYDFIGGFVVTPPAGN